MNIPAFSTREFTEQFVRIFEDGLRWRWPEVKIETKIHTGKLVRGGDEIDFHDRGRKVLEVRVKLPDSYIVNETHWKENATPLPQACFHILYALRLGTVATDAYVLSRPKDRCVSFWIEISERTFANFASTAAPLTLAEHYGKPGQ